LSFQQTLHQTIPQLQLENLILRWILLASYAYMEVQGLLQALQLQVQLRAVSSLVRHVMTVVSTMETSVFKPSCVMHWRFWYWDYKAWDDRMIHKCFERL
jgi:hypothetical protein